MIQIGDFSGGSQQRRFVYDQEAPGDEPDYDEQDEAEEESGHGE